MSLPTALGKNRFLTSRCLPTIVIIMVSLIQYYFLEMIPTVRTDAPEIEQRTTI